MAIADVVHEESKLELVAGLLLVWLLVVSLLNKILVMSNYWIVLAFKEVLVVTSKFNEGNLIMLRDREAQHHALVLAARIDQIIQTWVTEGLLLGLILARHDQADDLYE